jgi:hypothetical protein
VDDGFLEAVEIFHTLRNVLSTSHLQFQWESFSFLREREREREKRKERQRQREGERDWRVSEGVSLLID